MTKNQKYKCKICGNDLFPFISYIQQPQTAQYLPASGERVVEGINLEVCECKGCGIIQIPFDPVYYYEHAISSEPWSEDPFREEQKHKFIKEFNLQNKTIKRITERPKNEKYPAFFMFNYLEHFPSPIEILTQLYNNLEDPGVGIVEVPNFDDIIKERIFGEFIIDHLFYFTEKNLRLVCELSGFEVLRIEEIWEGASLSATIRKRKPLNSLPFIDNEIKLIKDIDDFISKFNSVTIYGAGHQTLMMLPMIKNIDKIPYIIDDFKPKQNTYTYVKSKKIVSRDNLITNPVDAIIIIVGWQYKHALNNIKSLNLNPKPHITLIKKATLELYEKF